MLQRQREPAPDNLAIHSLGASFRIRLVRQDIACSASASLNLVSTMDRGALVLRPRTTATGTQTGTALDLLEPILRANPVPAYLALDAAHPEATVNDNAFDGQAEERSNSGRRAPPTDQPVGGPYSCRSLPSLSLNGAIRPHE